MKAGENVFFSFFFHPEDMLNLSLNLNESQPIYAYKRYACKKVCSNLSEFIKERHLLEEGSARKWFSAIEIRNV